MSGSITARDLLRTEYTGLSCEARKLFIKRSLILSSTYLILLAFPLLYWIYIFGLVLFIYFSASPGLESLNSNMASLKNNRPLSV